MTETTAAESDLSRRGRRVRIVVTLLVAGVLLFGTLWGQDDLFPFGPFRMYASADKLNAPVADTRFELVDTTGAIVELTQYNTGIRRAEIEGQLSRFKSDPAPVAGHRPGVRLPEPARAGRRDRADHRPVGGAQGRHPDRGLHRPDGRHLEPAGGDPVSRRFSEWLTASVPRGRVAAFRTVIYLFVASDLVWFTPWVRSHAAIPGVFYRPLLVGRVLHLPTPTSLLVNTIFWTLIPLALLAATGRAPRLLGWAVFALYFEWMIIAMSYGKVDHDRFGLLIALAVLPTAGRARHGDDAPTERGGWALRVMQLAVIATYWLSSWAKLRFGGIGWLTSATLERAIIRRGTPLTDVLTSQHWILVAAQFGIVFFELTSPIVFFVGPRIRYWIIAYFYLFHAMVMATITISFAPHQAAMTSFLPLERVRPIVWARRLLTRAARPAAPSTGHVVPAAASTMPSHPEGDGGFEPPIGRPATRASAPDA